MLLVVFFSYQNLFYTPTYDEKVKFGFFEPVFFRVKSHQSFNRPIRCNQRNKNRQRNH